MTLVTTEMGSLAHTVYAEKYELNNEGWAGTAHRVVDEVVRPIFPEIADEITEAIIERKFVPGGRYLAQAGKDLKQYNNCFLYDVEDSKESWAELMHNITLTSMMGGGVGVCYSKLRGSGEAISGNGGTSSGPVALMQMVNEAGRFIKAGGNRRSALLASLHWNHPDIFDFITVKDWSDEIKAAKENDPSFPAPMDGTNISVILDDDFFFAYEHPNHVDHALAREVYRRTVEHMLTTGEPGFKIDIGENRGENLTNPCGEVTSRDSYDVCNLGSINLARVDSKEEFSRLVELGTAFLICGTLKSTLPLNENHLVRQKNRRLGLGLMGIYEWLVTRGYEYGPNEELASWLEEYAKSTEIAHRYEDQIGITHSVKTRAIAPTGTLSIIAETTSGIEPLFAIAYKRRYLTEGGYRYQYVMDATAQRLIDRGVDPTKIETAYDLANDPERRIAFQAWVQQYVDMAISSTLNLPSPDQQTFSKEYFADMLINHLPGLRGITAYPDGARGGQPINVVSYDEVKDVIGVEFEEFGNERGCIGGVCGI